MNEEVELVYNRGRYEVVFKSQTLIDESQEMNESNYHLQKVDGEPDRRDEDQRRLGKHIAKHLGNDYHIWHHPKGGLQVRHHQNSEFHLGKASAKLHEMGIPHRPEGFKDQKMYSHIRNTPQLYILSNDATDYGKIIKEKKEK